MLYENSKAMKKIETILLSKDQKKRNNVYKLFDDGKLLIAYGDDSSTYKFTVEHISMLLVEYLNRTTLQDKCKITVEIEIL